MHSRVLCHTVVGFPPVGDCLARLHVWLFLHDWFCVYFCLLPWISLLVLDIKKKRCMGK